MERYFRYNSATSSYWFNVLESGILKENWNDYKFLYFGLLDCKLGVIRREFTRMDAWFFARYGDRDDYCTYDDFVSNSIRLISPLIKGTVMSEEIVEFKKLKSQKNNNPEIQESKNLKSQKLKSQKSKILIIVKRQRLKSQKSKK